MTCQVSRSEQSQKPWNQNTPYRSSVQLPPRQGNLAASSARWPPCVASISGGSNIRQLTTSKKCSMLHCWTALKVRKFCLLLSWNLLPFSFLPLLVVRLPVARIGSHLTALQNIEDNEYILQQHQESMAKNENSSSQLFQMKSDPSRLSIALPCTSLKLIRI